MDIYSLLDTVVKIGLGAVITGVITYHLAKLSHEREIKKIGAVRRMESLEKASERAEQYIFAWRKMTSTIGGILKGRNAPEEDFSDNQWKRVRERDKDLLEAREHLYQVVARLRLLGATAAADSTVNMSQAVGRFRDPMILQRSTPTLEQFQELRTQVNDLTKTFHQELSSLYAQF